MKTMTYNGYTAKITYSQEDSLFVGNVLDIGKDVVSFHGSSKQELNQSFKSVVDSYVQAKRNRINRMRVFGYLFSRLRHALHL